MEAKSLRWWSTAQLEELANCLEVVWSNWQRDWVAGSAKAESSSAVSCQLAHEAAAADMEERGQGDWQPLLDEKVHDNAQVWLRVTKDFKRALESWLFGSPAQRVGFVNDEMTNAMLARDIVGKAWGDLLAALGIFIKIAQPTLLNATLDSQSLATDLPAFQNKLWSGAVRVTVVCGGTFLELHIPHDYVEKILQPPQQSIRKLEAGARHLTPLNQALNAQRIGIHAQLATLELDLGSLQSLAVGNVIPLPHNLDQPLTVISDTGAVLCTAHLVQHQGARALELFRISESNLH